MGGSFHGDSAVIDFFQAMIWPQAHMVWYCQLADNSLCVGFAIKETLEDVASVEWLWLISRQQRIARA